MVDREEGRKAKRFLKRKLSFASRAFIVYYLHHTVRVLGIRETQDP